MPVYENTDPGIKSMKGLHVYHYFLSNCAQRVTLALEEKRQNWTPHAINLFTQENTSDEYFRINPKGLVPALVHDGIVVTESMDILRYIEKHFPDPPLYPSDPGRRRKVDSWMDAATENHVRVVKTYMYSQVLGASKKPEMMENYLNKQEDQELIDFHQETLAGFDQSRVLEAERRLFAFYDDMEKELGTRQWLVGDEFSYADISWFVTYFMNHRVGAVDFRNYPNIRNWGERIMLRPSFKGGVARLQPWYAPLVCLMLRTKSRLQRGGPAPTRPRTVPHSP